MRRSLRARLMKPADGNRMNPTASTIDCSFSFSFLLLPSSDFVESRLLLALSIFNLSYMLLLLCSASFSWSSSSSLKLLEDCDNEIVFSLNTNSSLLKFFSFCFGLLIRSGKEGDETAERSPLMSSDVSSARSC